MSEFDELFTITCGRCKQTSTFVDWSGSWNLFRCPNCGYTFRRKVKHGRKSWEKYVELEEVKDERA